MEIEKNKSLLPYNTFGINVLAKEFGVFTNTEELEELLLQNNQNTKIILGGGSNVLFTKDVDGLVLKNEIKGIEIVRQNQDHIYVRVGAGENWHQLVMYCVQNNYAGIENLSLIPGNAGASPMQNIGAYGVEIKDVFEELEAYHIGENRLQVFRLADCNFGYRDSIFKNKYKGQFVITSVTYRLNKKPVFNTSYGAINQELEHMGIKELSIQAISNAVINIRSSKLPDPNVIGNAGSFFKNPIISNIHFNDLLKHYPDIPSFPAKDAFVKVPAGWLIEKCGWKGYRRGDAGCYTKQALVLVNYGHATGQEIFALSDDIIQSVRNKFQIELEREVNIV